MKQTIKNQRLFFISLIGIVTVSLIMGTTYAYQTLQVEKTEGSDTSVTLNVGKLNVTFDLKCKDGETCDENNNNYDRINLVNMPLSSNYKNNDYVEFILNTNDTTDDVAYQINLKEIDYGYITNGTKTQGCNDSSCIIDENFKYTVVEVIDNNENIISEGNFSDLSSTEYTLNLKSGIHNFINKGESQKIRIYLWLNETEDNQNKLENTYFNAKIEINSYFLITTTPNYPENKIAFQLLENSVNVSEEQEETLGYAILRQTPSTKPAEEINNEKESSLSLSLDDYGMSYYYRGNVKNNFLTFADMCWRIVRITGNGSVKLILEDSDQPCSETINGNWAVPLNSTGINYTGNYGYTEYSKNQLTASNGSKNSHTIVLMDYLHSKTSSTIAMANAFKTFQDSFTEIELSQLQSGNWCLMDNGYDESGNLLNDTQVMDKIVGGDHINYSSYVRLTNKVTSGYQPTLKCDGTIMDTWEDDVSNPTSMYVGTITADEVAYAGLTTTKNNDYNFMINSEFKKGSSGMNKSLYFWTFSPYYFDYSDSYGYRVASTGRLNGATPTAGYSIRPAIYLDSNVSIVGGTGVVGDAYIIG